MAREQDITSTALVTVRSAATYTAMPARRGGTGPVRVCVASQSVLSTPVTRTVCCVVDGPEAYIINNTTVMGANLCCYLSENVT